MAADAPEDGWTVHRALAELPESIRWEIDEGRLECQEPTAADHGDGVARVTVVLARFVDGAQLGRVFAGDPGFWLAHAPDTLRAPDVAFVGHARLAAIADPAAFAPVPPDLAVEVLSPSDRLAAVRRKAAQYLAFGVRSVWILDPRARRLEQYAAGSGTRTLQGDEATVEDPTLPGFRCRLRDLLPVPWPQPRYRAGAGPD